MVFINTTEFITVCQQLMKPNISQPNLFLSMDKLLTFWEKSPKSLLKGILEKNYWARYFKARGSKVVHSNMSDSNKQNSITNLTDS